MTTKTQRALLWGGLFLFALIVGTVLGRMVVDGLAGGGKMLADNAAANFWAAQDRAHNAGGSTPGNVAAVQGGSGAHVCEGCDASSLRSHQPGNQAFHYDSTSGGATGGPVPPPAPPTP